MMLRDLAASCRQGFFGRGVRSARDTYKSTTLRDLHPVLKRRFSALRLATCCAAPPGLRASRYARRAVRGSLRAVAICPSASEPDRRARVSEGISAREDSFGFPLCFREISNLQSVCARAASGEHGLSEERNDRESRGRNAEPPCFKVPSFVKSNKPGTDQ